MCESFKKYYTAFDYEDYLYKIDDCPNATRRESNGFSLCDSEPYNQRHAETCQTYKKILEQPFWVTTSTVLFAFEIAPHK